MFGKKRLVVFRDHEASRMLDICSDNVIYKGDARKRKKYNPTGSFCKHLGFSDSGLSYSVLCYCMVMWYVVLYSMGSRTAWDLG